MKSFKQFFSESVNEEVELDEEKLERNVNTVGAHHLERDSGEHKMYTRYYGSLKRREHTVTDKDDNILGQGLSATSAMSKAKLKKPHRDALMHDDNQIVKVHDTRTTHNVGTQVATPGKGKWFKDHEEALKYAKSLPGKIRHADPKTGHVFSESLELDEARKSTSYQFTHKPGDPESEKRLADLKASVKGTGKRVVLQGRLGKDNPNAHKYSKDAPRAKYVDGKRVNSDVSGKSGAHSHQRIQKADAAHHDVYVYNRNESAELEEASNLRITKVYNKFPKKATYAVHNPDRSYFKEFDSEDAAKKHLETKK